MNEIMTQVRIAKIVEQDALDSGPYAIGACRCATGFDAGLTVTGGTDNPAVAYDLDHPFLGQYSALTGNTLAGVLLPDQHVTREEMLRMYTINSAYACWQEHQTARSRPASTPIWWWSTATSSNVRTRR